MLNVLLTIPQAVMSQPLPKPRTTGGMPLMEALSKRQTSREFSETPLSAQLMSDLLWAAWGYNRPDLKKRTAPSSMNKQEMDVYILTADGVFQYMAEDHSLKKILSEDIRKLGGKQDFVAKAPVTLVFVADYSRMSDGTDQVKEVTSNTDAAFISQNVYLFCASENLATGVRAYVDKEALHKAMGLSPAQHITLAQSVGHFPAK